MKLNSHQKKLIYHALHGRRVPPEVHRAVTDIHEGKLKVDVPRTKIHFTDTDKVIQFTDHPLNQFTQWLIKRYGKDFGLLYFSALVGGNKAYTMSLKMLTKSKKK